jgi:hypothetical protein
LTSQIPFLARQLKTAKTAQITPTPNLTECANRGFDSPAPLIRLPEKQSVTERQGLFSRQTLQNR